MCISAVLKKKKKPAEEKREKLEFLTLGKSMEMFLVCTLMDQKAEGKEKKRSLKMPCFLRCDICFPCAPGWQEDLHGGCSPARKQVQEPKRAALPPFQRSQIHPVAIPRSCASSCGRLLQVAFRRCHE